MNLSKTDLFKAPNKNVLKNYPFATSRLDVLIHKIENKIPIELNSGKNVIISHDDNIKSFIINKNLLNLKRKNSIVFPINNDFIKLTDIKKTYDFGGGSGMGGGAENTKLTESAQCLYCSLAFNILKRKITIDDININNLMKSMNFIDVNESFENIMNNLTDDWIKSSVDIANELYERYNFEEFEFHRGSVFVDEIERTFKIVNKKEQIFNNINKWNPSDIWIVDKKYKNDIIKNIIKLDNFVKLNEYILKLYTENKLIGISLKKVVNNVNIKIYNNCIRNTHILKVKEFIPYLNENNPFSSKDSYIKFENDERIQFRSFNLGKPSQWQGELKGKYASGGKIGNGIIRNKLKKYSNYNLIDNKKLLKISNEYINNKNDYIINQLYKFYSYFTIKNKINIIDLKEQINNKKNILDFLVSKYLSLELLYGINTNKNKINLTCSKIREYAASDIAESSVFIKIY